MATIELFLRRSVHQQIIVVHFVSVFKYAKVRLIQWRRIHICTQIASESK